MAPFLLLLLVGGSDLARAYFVGIQVADGARQAALYAADNPDATASQIEAIAQENTGSNGSGLSATLLDCPASQLTALAAMPVSDPNAPGFLDQKVTVTCQLPLLTPLLPSPVVIGASATGLVLIGVLQVDSTTLPNATLDDAYSEALQVSGGVPPYTWTLSSGTLPTGLSFSSGGVISGTPTVTGTYTFTVQVTDSTGATATGSLSVTVGTGAITITPSTIPDGTATQPYGPEALAASGGTAPYTWTISSGALPAGVSLSSSGTIAGTPTTAGVYPFTVQATDSSTPSQQATQPMTMTVALYVPTATLPTGKKNQTYPPTQLPTPSGGTAPYTWSLSSGSLPPGLALGSSGLITGTPTSKSSTPYTFTVTVTDSASPHNSGTQNYSISVPN